MQIESVCGPIVSISMSEIDFFTSQTCCLLKTYHSHIHSMLGLSLCSIEFHRPFFLSTKFLILSTYFCSELDHQYVALLAFASLLRLNFRFCFIILQCESALRCFFLDLLGMNKSSQIQVAALTTSTSYQSCLLLMKNHCINLLDDFTESG